MTATSFGLASAFREVGFNYSWRDQSLPSVEKRLATHVRFFILRHGVQLGQIDITAYNRLGDTKLPLIEWGHRQSYESGVFLRSLDIGSFEIYHSSCVRTDETADSLIEGLGRERVSARNVDIRLDKQAFGLFNGLFSDSEKAARYPPEFAAYQKELTERGTFLARPPGGESLHDVQVKADSFIDDFLYAPPSASIRNIVAITHGTPALCAENRLTARGSDWVLENIDRVPNCRIRLIENLDGDFTARTLGDGLPRPLAGHDTRPAWRPAL